MEFCTSPDWQQLLETEILPGALAGVDLGPRVVEVGPGPGFTTDVLRRAAERVVAVEIDRALADQLAGRLEGTNVTLLVGDARDTGLPGASFTGAASFNMLHHVPTDEDQDAVFAELRRLLLPGGRLVLTDGMDSEGVRRFHVGDTYHPVDPTALPGRLRAAGFEDVVVGTGDLGWRCRAVVPGGEPASP